jgi:MFS family permease
MGRLRERIRESFGALREVYRNPALRRLEYAWAGSIIGSWAYSVAIVVYAYRHGGASAVGLVGLIRWLPAAAASPFAAILGDRYPRVRVMLATDLTRAVALAVMSACVLSEAPAAVVYVLAAAVAVITTAFQPAQSALLPSLARTPEELTAANVSSSTIESLGFCVGPALGGVLLAVANVWVVFALTSALFLWSAVQLTWLRHASEPPLGQVRAQLVQEATAGFRAIVHDRHLRLVVGLFSAQTLVYGAFSVLIAVTALQLLHLGAGGVGYLNAAVGVGGLVGGFISLTLVGRQRLASTFGIAIAGAGAPLLLVGVWPHTGVAVVVFAVIGLSMIVGDVSGYTILQRSTPGDVLARVFGVLHSLFYATVAVGAIVAPALIDAMSVRWALVVVGALLPILSALARTSLLAVDTAPVHPRELELLGTIPIFAPLPAPTLERLASRLLPVRAAAGERIISEGEHGDRFYVVVDGEIEISLDSGPPRVEGPGSYFGEIALLRDVPRTATVSARTDVELYALEREDFLGAVTGHSASAEAADVVVGSRLGVAAV